MTTKTYSKSDNLIFMIRISVTELARNLSAVFDQVEAGQTVQVYRGKKNIVRLVPDDSLVPNGTLLAEVFKDHPSVPGADLDDMAETLARLRQEDRDYAEANPWVDPWER